MKDKFVADICSIIDNGIAQASVSVHIIAALTYWRIGRRIVNEEQGGDNRAEYGAHLVDELAKSLNVIYGERYSPRRLREYRHFYIQVPDFEIWHSRVPNLTWTHIRQVLSVASDDARYWYLYEASREG